MLIRSFILLILSLTIQLKISANAPDSLRGTLNEYRTSFDVTHYELDLKIDPGAAFISGHVEITFYALRDIDTLQLELAGELKINQALWGDHLLDIERLEGRSFYLYLPQALEKDEHHTVKIAYEGKPQMAVQPPWQGGFVWSKDRNGNPYVGVACEGEGASIWWPCKDHLSDEPDSVTMHYSVPDSLVAVGNGMKIGEKVTPNVEGYKTYSWKVINPINLYNVTLYAGDYAHFDDKYLGISGDTLELDYYVLPYNLEKAKKHFRDVPKTLEAFEHFFGPYPFYKDGYKLVETRYLGMEHQSAIAYGNRYQAGYLGYDPSGMGWDYIIVHESGHEWFGNSISARDLAEIWIHESFTTYSEALFVEYYSDYEKAIDYLVSQRSSIQNRSPVVGPRGIYYNEEFHGTDKYYKGSWMLHTLRNIINDDEAWFELLRSFNKDFFHTVTFTEEVIDYFEENTEDTLKPVMRQYLFHKSPPVLSVKYEEGSDNKSRKDVVKVKWEVDEPGFKMPVVYSINKKEYRTKVGTEWITLPERATLNEISFNQRLFYFKIK